MYGNTLRSPCGYVLAVVCLAACLARPATANLVWDWSAGGGAHTGQFVTTGTTAAAGTHTILDVSFVTSSFMPVGSVSGGTYKMPISAYSTTAPYTLVWNGTTVVSLNAASNAGVNGLIVGDDALNILALFGTDSYGSHVPGDWEFQSENFTFQRGSDLVITLQPIPAPEITVASVTNPALADSGSQDFGSVRVGNDTTLTFTIGNIGTAHLTGLSVSIDPPSAFSVASQPGSPSIPGPNGATTFSIRFAPASGGAASGALHIASNDADENPFDINLGGIGLADCVVGPWSEWSACCNAAQSRARLVLLPAGPGGAACPALVETRACVDSIPVVTLTWPRAGSTYPAGIPVLFTASFTDAGPGAHTGSWKTGAVTETAIITEPSDGSPGSASVLHTFAAAGSYPVTLKLNSTCGTLDSVTVMVVAAADTTPAFPQAGILDTFNRANGAIGSDWTDMTSTYSIHTNRLAQAGGESYIQWQSATFGANQEVFVTLSTISASTLEHNLMLKTQGATWKTGHLEVSFVASASQVNVYSYTPGSGFTIQGTIPGVTFVSGDRFGARAFAGGRVDIFRNATLLGSISVAGWAYSALGGRIGLSAVSAASSRFDNFGGGDFVPTALVAVAPMAAVEMALLSLSNAFPNPTHSGVVLSLTLPHAEEVGMRILDIQGRQVWHAQPQRYGAGRWSLAWAGQTALGNASPGVYFARVRVGEGEFLRRIAVIR